MMFKFLQAATFVALAKTTELSEWMTRVDDILLKLDEDNFDSSQEGLEAKNLMVQAQLEELLHMNDKMDMMLADDPEEEEEDEHQDADLLEMDDDQLLRIANGDEPETDDEEDEAKAEEAKHEIAEATAAEM